MSNYSVETDSAGNIALTGAMTFDSAESILRETRGAFANGQAVRIDLANVSDTDSASLALILEWIATARRGGNDLSLNAIPERVLAIAQTSEVKDLIGRYSATDLSS